MVVKYYRVELHFDRHHENRAVKRVSLPKESVALGHGEYVLAMSFLMEALGHEISPPCSGGLATLWINHRATVKIPKQEAQVSLCHASLLGRTSKFESP